MPTPRLLERGDELAEITGAFEAAAAGSGRVVIVEGAAGVGKTVLLRAAAHAAGSQGHLVLEASGVSLEQELAWGVVRGVFGEQLSSLARRRRLLAGAAAACETLFEGRQLPPAGPENAAGILHGLYWLVAGLAAERVVVVVIDDLHWVDEPSGRWVAHLAARVGDMGVSVVVGVRDVHGSPLARALANRPEARVCSLAPLSPAASAELLAERLGGLEESLYEECHGVTGGNPFLLGELIRELEGRDRAVLGVEEIRRLRPMAIRRSALVRLAELGPQATRLAFAVLILGSQATVALVSELAELEPASAARVADELARAGVLSGGTPLRFVHPIVLESVAAEIGSAERARWHRQAAGLLGQRGHEAGVIASHLLACEPDGREQVVVTLRAAAAGALVRGAPEISVACLRRALAEPPAVHARAAVLFELGRVEGIVASGQGAGRLREALAATAEPSERAGIAIELADQLLMVGAVADAVAVCRAAREALPEEDRELHLGLLARLVTADGQDLRTPQGGLREIDSRSLTGATPGERLLLAALANVGISDGITPMPELAELALRGHAGTALLDDVTADTPQFWSATTTVMFGERFDETLALVAAAATDSRRRGSPRGMGFCAWCGSPLFYRLGRLAEAVEEARRAIELFAGEPLMLAYSRSFLVEALIDLGGLSVAREALASLTVDEAPPIAPFVMLRCVRARLRRIDGDAGGAARELLAAGQDLGQMAPVFWRWRAEAAVALHHAGELARARALAAEAVGEARAVQSNWALAGALRAQALAEDDIRPLREAEAATRDLPILLERAHVLTDLGAALRRRGHRIQAGTVLRQALDLADRCGATPLADTAAGELRLGGARPRRRRASGAEALTPAEHRVCEMAAQGLSNPAIAQALFVSLRTIETHLTRSYDKLGIRGREELTTAMFTATSVD